MVTTIHTKIAVARKRGQKGIVYRSPRIYLPTKLTDDSSFPFLEGDNVAVKIAGEKLIVQLSRQKRKSVRRPAVNLGRNLVRAARKKKGPLGKQGLKRLGTRTRR